MEIWTSLGIKIGVPKDSKFQNEHTIVVDDYKEALNSGKIDIYFGNDIVMKSSIFGGKRMIEEINYKVQNGDKDYTNSTSLSATNRKFK